MWYLSRCQWVGLILSSCRDYWPDVRRADPKVEPRDIHEGLFCYLLKAPVGLTSSKASTYALSRGIIIADTKFEFGLDEALNQVVLVDEVLTPDSSRFWPAVSYQVGRAQESLDKQYLRGKSSKFT